ncbi:MAG: hypothetical protein QXK38_03185 [Candidatus Caldarchaeum sp.]
MAERVIRGETEAGIVWNAEKKEKFKRWLEAEGKSHGLISLPQ